MDPRNGPGLSHKRSLFYVPNRMNIWVETGWLSKVNTNPVNNPPKVESGGKMKAAESKAIKLIFRIHCSGNPTDN